MEAMPPTSDEWGKDCSHSEADGSGGGGAHRLSDDPAVFREAMNEFLEVVVAKATRRAKEKGRPMDPWNEYEPEFIRGRLIEEIGEFLARFTTFDDENNNGIAQWQQEHDELFDIVALACSLWKVHR